VAIDWSKVKQEHVVWAAQSLSRQQTSQRQKHFGLFVVVGGVRLPAKQVLRFAYSSASKISLESVPKFSSGDATMTLLQRLGFSVERVTRTDTKG
jgi:hypothetical protein